MPGGHFVDPRAELGTLRRQESERALSFLGVKATHLGLPDGQLHAPEHRVALADHIIQTVRSEKIKAIATLGLNGYCGHDDHVAAHHAAVAAQRRLADENIRVPIISLNHNHQGIITIRVNRQQKLAALAMHESQFGISGELLRSHKIYQPLFFEETYDQISPRNGR